MKKALVTLSLALLLAGCTSKISDSGNSVDSVDSQVSTSQGVTENPISHIDSQSGPDSITGPDSSSISDSTSTSDSTSQSPVIRTLTVAELRTEALALTGLDSTQSLISTEIVSVEGKYLAENVDMWYRLMLLTDGGASINVRMPYGMTDILNPYKIGSCYKLTGYISMYYGRPELVYTAIEASSLNPTMDLSSIAPVKTVSQAYEHVNSLKINNKGNAFDSLITVTGQFAGEVNTSVMMFTDGNLAFQVHGDSKVTNGRYVGETYTMVLAVNMYLNKPSFEFISGTRISGVTDLVLNNPTATTSADLRKKVITDLTVYPKLYKFTGYVNAFVKDGTNYYFGLVDKIGDRAYDASSAQPNLSLRLDNHSNEYGRDLDYCAFVPYFIDDIKFEVTFAVYMYNGGNTIKTWQVFAFDNTLAEVA